MRNRNAQNATLNIRTFARNTIVVSAELKEMGDGWSCEWWISNHLSESITLLGGVTLPVYGTNESEAWQKVGFMTDEVIDFVVRGSDGAGTLAFKPRKEAKSGVGIAHIKTHRAVNGTNSLKNKQTYIEYQFLINEIGYLSSPAVALAELDKLPVTTIKKRVNYSKIS